MLRTSLLLFILLVSALVSAASSVQAQVTIPNTSTESTPANASEVNANFEAPEETLENACTAAGGTWKTATNTCAAGYDCFVGGFCAEAAIIFPPAQFNYTNVYEGDTQITEPALGADCNASPGAQRWDFAKRFFNTSVPHRELFTRAATMCQ